MKTEDSITKIVYNIIYIFIAVIFFVYALFRTDALDPGYRERIRSFSDGWFIDMNEKVDIEKIQGRIVKDKLILEKTLPYYVTDTDFLCFETKNLNVTVWIDGEEVYYFRTRENLTGIGYGFEFHEVSLSESQAGKPVKISYSFVYPGERGGGISRMYLCNSSDYIRMILSEKMLSFSLSGLIIVFGLLMIIMYFGVSNRSQLPFDILSLGIATLVLGVWLLIDTNVLLLITGHLYLWRETGRLIIFMAGYPLISFFNSITLNKRPLYLQLAFVGSAVCAMLMLLLRYSAGVDFIFSFSKFAAIYIVFCFALIIAVTVDNIISCRMSGIAVDMKPFYIGMSIMLICGSIDVVVFLLRLSKDDSYGVFTRGGMVFFILMMLRRFLNWWSEDRSSVERDRFINRALQYAISSDSTENSIQLMLEYIGNEFHAKRVYIFEKQEDGRFRGTYEWFADGAEPGGIELLYLPYEGVVDRLYHEYNKNDHKLIVENIERFREPNPSLYSILKTNHINSLVTAPIEVNGRITGLVGVTDADPDKFRDIAEIIRYMTFFLIQFLTQRDEQKRLFFYSYNDAVTGARNRRAFRRFIESELNKSASFGYLQCDINDLETTNATFGYEAGDKLVVNMAADLMEVFGEANVYRMSGTEFVVFGFESDEVSFNSDIDRVRQMLKDQNINVSMGYVYCINGTTDINRVMSWVSGLVKRETG